MEEFWKELEERGERHSIWKKKNYKEVIKKKEKTKKEK